MYRLAQASAAGDRDALQRTMDLLVAEAVDEGRHGQAQRLSGLIRRNKPRRSARNSPSPELLAQPVRPRINHELPEAVQGLLFETPARRRLDDLVLPERVDSDIREFLHEQNETALLRANSIEPRHALLLVGPPGNGKTSLAEAIAAELGSPFLTVRYDGVVDSFLGETAARIGRIIEFAAASPCVLFFDEFDAIGKERGDIHETGEIKRVVNSLLVQLDSLPSHCVVVCATNHPELLDRAVWRRFELKIELPMPGRGEIARMYDRFASSLGDVGLSPTEYAARMHGKSFSEIEQFNLDVKRRLVLSRGSLTAAQAIEEVLGRWARQYGPSSEKTATHGGQAHRKNPARTGHSKTDPERQKAQIPEQGILPVTS